VIAATEGSEWVMAHIFWMDLLFGFGVAALLALVHAGGVAQLRRVLASRLGLWLGLFSYSIYLIHDPIVGVLDKYAFGPMDLSPLATFGATLVLGLPVILALCYGFHLLFEAPFLRRRDFGALRTLPILRLLPQGHRPAPPPFVAPAGAARD
jgi:peptidoglycan/LPS O-acetylase OafA/YrhL